MVLVQELVTPVTVQLRTPVGSGRPLLPTTVALKVRACPTVGRAGVALKIIEELIEFKFMLIGVAVATE